MLGRSATGKKKVAYGVRLTAYSHSNNSLFSFFSVSLEKVDCKHNVCIISSEISVFNFGYLLSEHEHNQLRDTNY